MIPERWEFEALLGRLSKANREKALAAYDALRSHAYTSQQDSLYWRRKAKDASHVAMDRDQFARQLEQQVLRKGVMSEQT